MTEVHLSGSCGTRSVYHTNPDCVALDQSNCTRTEELKHFEHLPECQVCKNGGEMAGGPDQYTEKTCEHCGETYKKLPQHLRGCDGV